jgi:hypothetical protein
MIKYLQFRHENMFKNSCYRSKLAKAMIEYGISCMFMDKTSYKSQLRKDKW